MTDTSLIVVAINQWIVLCAIMLLLARISAHLERAAQRIAPEPPV
jgi:hypothetical protein